MGEEPLTESRENWTLIPGDRVLFDRHEWEGEEPLIKPRSLGRGATSYAAARQMIGRRIHWIDDDPGHGTITDVTTTRNGYVMFVVAWDDGSPDWWATVVSPRSSALVVTDA